MPALARMADGMVLILYGDVPLLRRETLEELVGTARRYGCLALVTATPPDATGYGRILRDERGHVIGVVEQKDASPDERAITEINAGIYCGPADFFREATLGLGTGNAQGEYYLTDVVARAARSIGVSAIEAAFEDVCGINDRQQLAEAEATLRGRINRALQAHVTFRDPASAVVEPDVEVGVDVELGRNVSLRGRTKHRPRRAHRRRLHPDRHRGRCRRPCSSPTRIATDAVIGAGAIIGPFAHLRPGTRLGPDVHLGNFVETKKTVIGRGSKANHLSYLGDTTIGEKVNVGAGTITCNYDGYKKYQTVIEDGAFIGSDTQLVAPVRVGKRAVVGAGTTVTRDVPDGCAGAVARAPRSSGPATPTRSRSGTPAPGTAPAVARSRRQRRRQPAKPRRPNGCDGAGRPCGKACKAIAREGAQQGESPQAQPPRPLTARHVTSADVDTDGTRLDYVRRRSHADVGQDVLRRESAGRAQHQPGEGEGRGGRLPVQDHRRRRRHLDRRSRCRRRPRASRASTGRPSARSRRATPTSAAWSTAACRRRCRCSSAAS